MTDLNFYVYFHIRDSDGSVFYVGKGSGKRITKTQHRNLYWQRVAQKHGWRHAKVFNTKNEPCAFSMEKALIVATRHCGAQLTNCTNGGEGPAGNIKSPETGARISAARTGKGLRPDPDLSVHSVKQQSVWYHENGEIFRGTHIDLHKKTGLSLKILRGVQYGSKFSHKGWKVAGVNNSRQIPKADLNEYIFSKSGEDTFVGRRYEFCRARNVNSAGITKIMLGYKNQYKGWKIRAL